MSAKTSKQVWEESFEQQVASQAYNTTPEEALVRSMSYYLRARYKPEELSRLKFAEMGCGAGPNLTWLAEKGVLVTGIDISPTALGLCRERFRRGGLENRLESLLEASVDKVPLPDQSFDGIIESCVFQHLNKGERERAFGEVRRLLKPGGLFVGHMLDAKHTVFQKRKNDQLPDDPGTLRLEEGGSKYYLTNIGLAHFFTKSEVRGLLDGFSVVDPCLTTYYIPHEEARKRGYEEYLQSMWTVYAVK